MEGGCFGLTACQVVSEEGARIMKMSGFPWFKFPGGGFSVVRPRQRACVSPRELMFDADFRPGWFGAHRAHRPGRREGRHRRDLTRSDRQSQARGGHHGKLVSCYSPCSLCRSVVERCPDSSRHDLLHVVAHGKNWRAATYEDEAEQAANDAGIADVKNVL